MMHQNRVDPEGNIFATDARGSLMGNRGVIHNADKRIVRPFRHKAWIACALRFKGRHRHIMTPNRWTELFFLDEATAFAAGHRPCAECRRERYNEFKRCWLKGNPQYGFDTKTSIRQIDAVIHQERVDKMGNKVIFLSEVANLPTGTFFLQEGKYCMVNDGAILRWTATGYHRHCLPENLGEVAVLTPRSVVAAFQAGYAVA